MKNLKNNIIGFILFFLTSSFTVGIGILVYSLVGDRQDGLKGIAVFFAILLPAIIFFLIDMLRRKIMIYKPLKEILNATELMTRGNFKIKLIPAHSYEDYDEFDLIKDDLNKMANELSKNEVLKSDFIANLSHEIKTPLSVIQNYSKALTNDSLSSEDKKKYLDSLQDACKRLTNLVSNILKLNKLENQKLAPEITRFNLSESLTTQILQYEELIEKKKLVLECDIEEDVYIDSEESYLEIIWNNLMSNAIKFTESGGTIKVSLTKLENKYIIKFKDSGCGMDEETGMHIFEKFYQGDTSHSKEGNGLGLPLVKRVIDILGGKISVESEVGVGTTFTVTIREV